MSTIIVDHMTPAQCRAARAFLNLTQAQLARSAQLGLSTIVDCERMRRSVSPEAIDAIRASLARIGVEFIDANGAGEGVRFRKSPSPKKRR
jgi:transcriptional regulator with XRE-family HTH domain